MPCGLLNWPGPAPNVPQVAIGLPEPVNFLTWLLAVSVTYTLPAESTPTSHGAPPTGQFASGVPVGPYAFTRLSPRSARYPLPDGSMNSPWGEPKPLAMNW